MLAATAHVIAEIRAAFPPERPAVFVPLVNSFQGDEPALTASAFADKDDWTRLEPEWLDEVPNGYSSALSFLSDEAICFYIPAFMVADLNRALQRATPVFHLTHGFFEASQHQPVSPRSSGTWTEYGRRRWSHLDAAQARAVVRYLEWQSVYDFFGDAEDAKQALAAFWYKRAAAV